PDRDLLAAAGPSLEEVREVIAGGKVHALSAEEDRAGGFVRGALLNGIGERTVHPDGDRVSPLRPRERDRKQRPLFLHPHMLAHRLLLNRMTRPVSPAMAGPSTKAARQANPPCNSSLTLPQSPISASSPTPACLPA